MQAQTLANCNENNIDEIFAIDESSATPEELKVIADFKSTLATSRVSDFNLRREAFGKFVNSVVTGSVVASATKQPSKS